MRLIVHPLLIMLCLFGTLMLAMLGFINPNALSGIKTLLLALIMLLTILHMDTSTG